MLSKLSEGAFGTVSNSKYLMTESIQSTTIIPEPSPFASNMLNLQVYIAEANGITEYSSSMSLGTRLVAIKFLGENSSEKEK